MMRRSPTARGRDPREVRDRHAGEARGRSARIVAAGLAVTLLGFGGAAVPQPAGDEPVPIAAVFESWTPVNAADGTFGVENGALRVEGAGGWLRSERRYADFTLRAELRFLTEDADSGFFVRAEPGVSFGPGWPGDSYQVQLRNPLGESPFPPIGGLFRHGARGGATRFDEAAARAAFTGTNEWQDVVVDVRGETLSVTLNGTTVTEADGITNPSGFVGIQRETGALEIRSLVIEPH